MRSDNPSQSLYLLVDEMRERGMRYLEYNWEEDYVCSPKVDRKEVKDFRFLCSDVCITDEYDKPEGWVGFMIVMGEDGDYKFIWDVLE